MKKFSKKSINKTIAAIDRYFTWDNRNMVCGKSIWVISFDGYSYVSFKPFGMHNWMWFSYKTHNHTYKKVIKNYHDLNEINKLIKVMF